MHLEVDNPNQCPSVEEFIPGSPKSLKSFQEKFKFFDGQHCGIPQVNRIRSVVILRSYVTDEKSKENVQQSAKSRVQLLRNVLGQIRQQKSLSRIPLKILTNSETNGLTRSGAGVDQELVTTGSVKEKVKLFRNYLKDKQQKSVGDRKSIPKKNTMKICPAPFHIFTDKPETNGIAKCDENEKLVSPGSVKAKVRLFRNIFGSGQKQPENHRQSTPQPQRANYGNLRSSMRQPLKPISTFARNQTASAKAAGNEQKLATPREAVEKRMSVFTDKDGHVLRHQDGGGGGRHRSLGEIAMEKKKQAEAKRQTSLLSSQQQERKKEQSSPPKDETLLKQTTTSPTCIIDDVIIPRPTHSRSSPTFSTPTKSATKKQRISVSSSSDDDDDTFSMTNTSVTSRNSTFYDRAVSDLESQSPLRRVIDTPIAEVAGYDEFVEDMHHGISAQVPLTTFDMLQPSLIDAIHNLESSVSSPTTSDMKTVMDAPTTTLQRPAIVTSPTEATATTTDDVFYDVADPAQVTSEPNQQQQQQPAAVDVSFVSSTTSLSSSCYETASDDTAHVLNATQNVSESPPPAASTVTSQQQQQERETTTTADDEERREGEEKGNHSHSGSVDADDRKLPATSATSSSSCASAGEVTQEAGGLEESALLSSSSSCSSFEILESMPTLTPVKKVSLWKSMSVKERKAKLRQAWKKNKDIPVSDDESVFSDGGSSDDCSDIDEDWLNEGADTDDSCISRVDYHNNNKKKRQQQQRQRPQITTAKPTVKQPQQPQPKNNNNGNTAVPTAKKEPVKIQKQTTPSPLASKPQQKAPPAVVVKVIEQNDVIKPAPAQRVPTLVDERKPEAVATPTSANNNNTANDDDSSIVTEQQPKVGSALKFWAQRLSSTKKHSGFDASRDSETFNGNTLGRLQGAKALFQSMSSSSSRTPHLPRKTSALQQQKEDDMMTSQTLPRSWKGNKKRQPISNIFETSSSSPSPPPVAVVTRAESMRATSSVSTKKEEKVVEKVQEPPKMIVKEATDVVKADVTVEEPKAAVEKEEVEEEAPKTVEEIKAKFAAQSEPVKEEMKKDNVEPQQEAVNEEPCTPEVEEEEVKVVATPQQEPLKMVVKEDEPFEMIEPDESEPATVVVATNVQNEIAIKEEKEAPPAVVVADEAVKVEPPQATVEEEEEKVVTVVTKRPKPVMLVPLKRAPSPSSSVDEYDGNFTDEDLDDVSSLSSGSDDDDVDASFLDDDDSDA